MSLPEQVHAQPMRQRHSNGNKRGDHGIAVDFCGDLTTTRPLFGRFTAFRRKVAGKFWPVRSVATPCRVNSLPVTQILPMLGARGPRIARIYELHRRVTQLSDAIFHRHKFYRRAKLSNSPIVHRPGRAKRILSLYLTSVELRFIRVTATYELVRSGAITQLFRALETIVHTAFDSFSTRMSTNFFAWPERNGARVGNLISGAQMVCWSKEKEKSFATKHAVVWR